jgi:hypothetical protein
LENQIAAQSTVHQAPQSPFGFPQRVSGRRP